MIVQRLASVATGKAMKYERLGPQEFVPYKFKELTVENIQKACFDYYSDRLVDSDNKKCDILASQNGPSCSKLSHIKNFKLIYIRFITRTPMPPPPSSVLETLTSQKPRSKMPSSTVNIPSQKRVYYPQSISISTMLKVGTAISYQVETPKAIKLLSFDVAQLKWSSFPIIKEFTINDDYFAQGGFRLVYKAKSIHDGKEYVVKRFKPETLKSMNEINHHIDKVETIESMARKAIQTHMLAKNFALQMASVVEETCKSEFGDVFKYEDAFFGIIQGQNEFVMVEKFIPGVFKKYINNNGESIEGGHEELIEKAECLSHFSYQKSKGKLLLVDIQGSDFDLYDPEFATAGGALDNEEDQRQLMFCMGNLSTQAVNKFLSSHLCNQFCRLVKLEPFK